MKASAAILYVMAGFVSGAALNALTHDKEWVGIGLLCAAICNLMWASQISRQERR